MDNIQGLDKLVEDSSLSETEKADVESPNKRLYELISVETYWKQRSRDLWI